VPDPRGMPRYVIADGHGAAACPGLPRRTSLSRLMEGPIRLTARTLSSLLGAAWLLLAAACRWAGPPVTPPVLVRSVEELGKMERPAKIRGRDGGVSGRFAGRSVWVYGDSVATERGAAPTTWRNNTMSWTSDLTAADGIRNFVQPADEKGAAREFFPVTAEERAFNDAHVDRGDGKCQRPCGARYAVWGSGPIADLKRGRAILSYSKIYAEPGEWNFHILGSSLALWQDFEEGPVRPLVKSRLPDRTLLFDESEGEFAVPALSEPYLYLFSCSGGPRPAHGCRLARARVDSMLDRDAYTFRAANGWSKDFRDAVELFAAPASVSVHYNPYLSRWLAVYMSYGHVIIRAASHIDGPWSEETNVFEPRERNVMHAFGHPEFQERGGAVEYISYLADEFRLLRVQFNRTPPGP
jgi:uncharacterized protein DUF4185